MAPTNIYAAVSDVQALINALSGTGLTIGTTSVPTTAQVEGFLDQVAAEVDGMLRGAGYGTVPATGTSDVLMIRRHVAQKAAAMTYHAGFGGFGETPARVEQWEKEYADFLKRLGEKSIRLVDQAPARRAGVIYVGRYTGD